jgi:uncharacterized protein (TIGR03435 family)
MSRLLIPIVCVCAAVTLAAQAPQQPTPGALPSFEVASIRINKTGTMNRLFRPSPGGRLDTTNVRLRDLVMFAYQVRPFQVEGGPDWIDTVGFDIAAKAETEVPPLRPGGPAGPYQLMMRSLLADRFKLTVHNETKELPIYALTLARQDGKLGPAMKASTTDCEAMMKAAMGRGGGPPPPGTPFCGLRISPTRLEMGGFAMSELVNGLGNLLQRTVVNRTGLPGSFDLTLNFSPEQLPGLPPGVQLPAVDPNAPSIFTALQEQAGLKLESTRGPVQVVVIDRAEMPVED